MVQALCLSATTAIVTARAGNKTVKTAKAVVARCVKFPITISIREIPLHVFSPSGTRCLSPCIIDTSSLTDFDPPPPVHQQNLNSAKPVVSVPARVTKALPVGLAATAPLFASMPAQAQTALFQIADLADGNVDEETALYVLVGGSLAICAAVLSLVIGSDQFIKNFSKK